MRRLRVLAIVAASLLCAGRAAAAGALGGADPAAWQAHFDEHGVEGCFILHDLATSETLRLDAARCDRRFIPASTFKLPNTLIGLETGVIPDETFALAWDGTPQWQRSWERDHTLPTAFRSSVLWFYQEVARRIGPERMGEWIDRVGYGNRDISGPIDQFWLEGPLAISPNEQLEFLHRLVRDQLPFSGRSMQITRRVALMEQGTGWKLFGKTGWTQAGGRNSGWIIGWAERDGRTVLFVLQAEAPLENKEFSRARLAIAERILNDLGFIDGPITYGNPGK